MGNGTAKNCRCLLPVMKQKLLIVQIVYRECWTIYIGRREFDPRIVNIYVPMTEDMLEKWSDANLKFLSKECCFVGGNVDHKKCLQRLVIYII